jgi:hypothetical protein
MRGSKPRSGCVWRTFARNLCGEGCRIRDGPRRVLEIPAREEDEHTCGVDGVVARLVTAAAAAVWMRWGAKEEEEDEEKQRKAEMRAKDDNCCFIARSIHRNQSQKGCRA